MNNEDKIFSQLAEMNNTLVRLTVSVEEHVRRTNLLEQKVENNESRVSGDIQELKIKSAKLEGGLRLLTLMGSAIGGAIGAAKFFNFHF